ncbi:hypothetical protein C8F04DRAFT_1237196 [Mycena alexandri]|uniref:Uncharacterized protein n=1 Tax=Mycena alexandri TaxID=1745969 RepID=A0AAD6WVL9_9AGAR|nr:hypothetical protein C8F04DRAFT_1237196 [Mycena alexandri]
MSSSLFGSYNRGPAFTSFSVSRGRSPQPISSVPTTANFRASPTKVSATGAAVSDLRPSTTTADVTPKEVNPAAEARQIDKWLDDLCASCPYSSSSIKLVEPAVWLEIKNDHQERLRSRCKLEYIWSSKEMIVTWPTWVHETFDVSLSCFKAIAAADPDTYSCLYNKNFRLFKQENQEADLIPDFALARCLDSNPWQPLVVLECAASQTATALDRKVRWWLNDPKISLVIGVDIQIGQYRSPDPAVLTKDVDPPTFNLRDLLAMEFPPLGPININNHHWGCNIRKIMVGLHAPPDEDEVSRQVEGSSRSFDLTPVDVNDSAAHAQLLRRQETVDRIVGTVVKDAINPQLFDTCFGSTQAFNLSWGTFYSRLYRALRDDAFQRFQDYYNVTPATAARVPVPSSSLKRALAEVDEDEATPLEVIEEPVAKRVKLDKNTRSRPSHDQ